MKFITEQIFQNVYDTFSNIFSITHVHFRLNFIECIFIFFRTNSLSSSSSEMENRGTVIVMIVYWKQ